MLAMTTVEFWLSVIAGIVGAVALLAFAIAKRHLFTPVFVALRYWFRFYRVFSSIQMTCFNRCRDDYALFRAHAASVDRYVATAQRHLKMIGIHLVTGIQIDGLCETLREMLTRKNGVEVHISLLDPNAPSLMKALAPSLDLTTSQLTSGIKATLDRLRGLRESLPQDVRQRFHLYRHHALPFGSAILIDSHEPNGRIQIETKCYKAPSAASWGFELRAGGSHPMYKTLVKSFEDLIQDATKVDDHQPA